MLADGAPVEEPGAIDLEKRLVGVESRVAEKEPSEEAVEEAVGARGETEEPPPCEGVGGADIEASPEAEAALLAEEDGVPLGDFEGKADLEDEAEGVPLPLLVAPTLSVGAEVEGDVEAALERVALPSPPEGRPVALAEAWADSVGVARAEKDGGTVADFPLLCEAKPLPLTLAVALPLPGAVEGEAATLPEESGVREAPLILRVPTPLGVPWAVGEALLHADEPPLALGVTAALLPERLPDALSLREFSAPLSEGGAENVGEEDAASVRLPLGVGVVVREARGVFDGGAPLAVGRREAENAALGVGGALPEPLPECTPVPPPLPLETGGALKEKDGEPVGRFCE